MVELTPVPELIPPLVENLTKPEEKLAARRRIQFELIGKHPTNDTSLALGRIRI